MSSTPARGQTPLAPNTSSKRCPSDVILCNPPSWRTTDLTMRHCLLVDATCRSLLQRRGHSTPAHGEHLSTHRDCQQALLVRLGISFRVNCVCVYRRRLPSSACSLQRPLVRCSCLEGLCPHTGRNKLQREHHPMLEQRPCEPPPPHRTLQPEAIPLSATSRRAPATSATTRGAGIARCNECELARSYFYQRRSRADGGPRSACAQLGRSRNDAKRSSAKFGRTWPR